MREIGALIEIMARLRDPAGGCPWDLEQSFESVAPHTLEEAYEVDHAIAQGDMAGLRDELGDLLMQVVFHARMAEEAGHFDFGDVVGAICDKLVRRHPHVFGDARVETAAEQTRLWEALKERERDARAGDGVRASVFDDIPAALPALARARKLQRRAGRASLDDAGEADASTAAEGLGEMLRCAERVLEEGPPAQSAARLGALLFACAQLAGRFDLDPESALRATNRGYEARLRRLEAKRSG